ncbi:4-oxalocrotonate tautomerase family protein [Streptomyces sp. NPDC088557]|uniref:tautomerase family protein n=1 Tax=Streptomyces sp. NPDC088557 TaxID=3365867 RepID=UPI003824D1D6
MSAHTSLGVVMPLVEITVPEGSVTGAAAEVLQQRVADSVLTAMQLPHTDFFASATWVYVREAPKGLAVTGAGTPPGVLVVLTPLKGFLTPERNEALGAEVTRHTREATGSADTVVWLVVNEIPEGNWAVNDALTRRAKIDEFIAEAAAVTRAE